MCIRDQVSQWSHGSNKFMCGQGSPGWRRYLRQVGHGSQDIQEINVCFRGQGNQWSLVRYRYINETLVHFCTEVDQLAND